MAMMGLRHFVNQLNPVGSVKESGLLRTCISVVVLPIEWILKVRIGLEEAAGA